MKIDLRNNKGFTRTPKFGVTPKGGGFTLIELLVVVAIVSLLSSIVMVSLNSARLKARNAMRISQIEQLRNAFSLALSDSPYPNVGTATVFTCLTTSCVWSGTTYNADATVDAYLSSYIKKPTDPSTSALVFNGFLYLTPNNWAGDHILPAGYYIAYMLEPGASNCGPGVLYNTGVNYIQCQLPL